LPAGTLVCLECDANCLTCETTATTCLTCRVSDSYYLMRSDSNCVNPCIDGYYGDAGTGACELCDDNCLTCVTTAITCVTCRVPDSYFLMRSTATCDNPCIDGWYGEVNTGACELCDTNCKTCVTTATTCLTCYTENSFFLQRADSTCDNPCVDG
jgi:hypothetical protein